MVSIAISANVRGPICTRIANAHGAVSAESFLLEGVKLTFEKRFILILLEPLAVSAVGAVHPASFATAWRLSRCDWFARWFGLQSARHIGRPNPCLAVVSRSARRGH